MKKFVLFMVFMAFFMPSLCLCQEKIGTLHVFSKIPDTQIYVNDELKGTDKVKLFNIISGSYLVKGISKNKVVFEEVVKVNPGEITTVFIAPADYQPVTTVRKLPVNDYSLKTNSGWFIQASYITNLYQAMSGADPDHFASTLGLGIGFQIPIAPRIDFIFTLDKGQYSDSSSNWYLMPVTADVQFSWLPSTTFGGKQYYGLGLGYYMTDLNNSLVENLTAIGYHFYYGIEMPAGPDSAFYFNFDYFGADLSRNNYQMVAQSITLGYRFYGE